MEKDIVAGAIGAEASYGVKFDSDKHEVQLFVKFDGKLGGGMLSGYIPAKAVLEEIKKAIPGTLDDYLIDAVAGVAGV